MPAPFAASLCGYRRANGKPNTSDASEAFSVELGTAMFEAMNVPSTALAADATGSAMSSAVAADLTSRLASAESDLEIAVERPLEVFDQFRHVAILRNFEAEPSEAEQKAWNSLTRFARSKITKPAQDAARLDELIAAHEVAVAAESARRRQIVEDVGSESLLGLDVVASRNRMGVVLPTLEMGLSAKWTLRTDRAQDCRSQGAKMAALRRGRMPHFAAITMEPRPYMLNILGGGSGEIDCVYHLDLPSLGAAIEMTCVQKGKKRSATRDTFRRLVEQRRLRDYDELAAYAASL